MEKERKKRAPRKTGESVVAGTAVEKKEKDTAAEAGKPGTVIELPVIAAGVVLETAAEEPGKSLEGIPEISAEETEKAADTSAEKAQETTTEASGKPLEAAQDTPVGGKSQGRGESP